MDLNEIFRKIQKLSFSSNNHTEIRQLCSENIEQILHELPDRILNNDGGNLLKCLLNVFLDNSPSHVIKVKIINKVLEVIRKQNISLTHCGNITSWLRLELPKLPVKELVKWTDECIQTIVDDSDVNMIWRDILPETFKTILSHDIIEQYGTEMSSEDYKAQCLLTLCQCQWKDRQIVPLVTMFIEMKLYQNDHKQIVNKICSYISNTPPDSLPPLVYQLLRFCLAGNLEIVLANLSYYFTSKLYSKLEPPPQDSESTNNDIDDFVQYSPAEMSNCLSTCLYHFTDGPVPPDVVQTYVKAWPKTQVLRNPFIIDLALSVSESQATCLDVVKSSIEQRILDEMHIKESAWLRTVLPPDVDIVSLLKVLTIESGSHRQLTSRSLINLGFNLLSVNANRPTAPMCWSHGKLILVRISKLQPETGPHVLTILGDRLSENKIQYSDCLYILCKLTPVSVERCTQLTTILETCRPSQTDFKNAAAVFDAVSPLLNYSMRTRDALVMVCRKGLHSRESLNRCLALSGFLTVLGHIKLSNTSCTSSQSYNSNENSTFCYLTQLTVELHATEQGNTVRSRIHNETLCMEVILILQRCLLQDAAVKQLLYTKLYNCIKEKTALHQSILEMLHAHLVQYVPNDDETPLLLDNCVQETAVTAILVEPIANLLYLVAQFLQQDDDDDLEDILSSQIRDTSQIHLRNQLSTIMDRLCATKQLGVINMDDPVITDLTPESKAKNLKVQQIIQCYEALVAYKIMQWNPNSTGLADTVYRLYRNCYNITEQAKTPTKPKKGGKSSANNTKEVKSQKSQKSQNEKDGARTRLNNTAKDKTGPFKPLPCLWNMKFCLRIIYLLYSDGVSWSSASERNSLRARRDFHHWTLKCVLSALTADLEKKVIATYVTGIAAVMYKRCVRTFQDMCTFDDETALYCVDVFKVCLDLIHSSNYSFKVEKLLMKIVDETDVTQATCIAKILESVHSALAQLEADATVEKDAIGKKLSASLSGLAGMLLVIPVASCLEMCNVIIKFEDFIRTSHLDCVSLIPSVLTAGCREQQEAQFLDDLLRKLLMTLGTIDEQEDDLGETITDFPAVDTNTGHTALIQVCAHLNTRLEYVEHLLNRAHDLTSAETLPVRAHRDRIAKERKEVYISIVLQLCQMCTWISACANLRCSIGAPSDKVLSTCTTHYRILARLAKQLDGGTAQLVRFERLLKLTKKLLCVINNFIPYVESSQEKDNPNQVWRRTKLIPALVFGVERFGHEVTKMANKAKLDWHHYLTLGTARDYRLDVKKMREAFTGNDDNDGSEYIDDDNADRETLVLQPSRETEEDKDNEERSKRLKIK